jgi:hypothetical protein
MPKYHTISYLCSDCFERYRTEHELPFGEAQYIATFDMVHDFDDGEPPEQQPCAKCNGQATRTIAAPMIMRASHRDGVNRFKDLKEARSIERELKRMTLKKRKSSDDAQRMRAEIATINSKKSTTNNN